MYGLSENALSILERRYLKDGETPLELFRRVAIHVAKAEENIDNTSNYYVWKNRFYEIMTSFRFLPNSPTLVNAGSSSVGCLSACFVISPEDTMTSIMEVASDAAMIEKWGGGIGYGFSKLRHKGAPIATTHGEACGPVAVMKLYSQVGATLTQGAFRLGAHMGQLDMSHPDIEEFIHCKDGDDTLSNFNISVQATDKFMCAVRDDDDWDLKDPRDGSVVRTVSARDLWDQICLSAWKTGDPGIVFMDRVLETQPNPQMGDIQTSNPCAEEFLEDYNNCCLGSINLDKHVVGDGWDLELLEETIRYAVRFLDDVIEVNRFPLRKLREVNLATRRIGLGVMGWADALARLGIRYDSTAAIDMADQIGRFIENTAWDESERLAVERGPFLQYEWSALKERGMPPVRNSSVLTIAPTGTISRIAGCSSGIEPHYALAWWSNVLWSKKGSETKLIDAPKPLRDSLSELDDSEIQRVLERIAANPNDAEAILRDYAVDPGLYRTALDIAPEWHVTMQSKWQSYMSNGVSKTVNMPNDAKVSDVGELYMKAWAMKCKAVSLYRDGSKSQQVLEVGSKSEDMPLSKVEPRDRPKELTGRTVCIKTSVGNMYVTVNVDETGSPFEVFVIIGKSGSVESAHLEGLSRMITLALRCGVSVSEIVAHLRDIEARPVWDGNYLVKSPEDGIAHVLDEHLVTPSPRSESGDRCEHCNGSIIHQGGCTACQDCGYTKCD